MPHTIDELREKQALPLALKIRLTEDRVRAWVNEFGEEGVYLSFSGGKDSTVLLDIIRERMGYTRIPAVFVDVPTQYPELKEFVMTFDNVTIIRPQISFREVCEKYGFPLISKEVSGCVQGARKYLTSIFESESLNRQTDRQTDPPYKYNYNRLCGYGEYAKSDRGGYDNKYRRLRGIGKYTKSANG